MLSQNSRRWITHAIVEVPCGFLIKQSRRFNTNGHLRNHPLDELMVANRRAKRLALFCIRDAFIETPTHESCRCCTDVRTRLVEGLHRELEALTFRRQNVFLGHDDVIKKNLRRVAGTLPEFVLFFTHA